MLLKAYCESLLVDFHNFSIKIKIETGGRLYEQY